MIDALYCRSEAVLLAMHVWLYVVAVLYRKLPNSDPFGRGGKSIYPDPNPFQTPRIEQIYSVNPHR